MNEHDGSAEHGPAGSAHVERTILRDHDAMLAVGDFGALFEAYHRHARRWDLPLDPLGLVMMHQALAGACLQLAFRVVEETSAWTLNVGRPPLNLFVTGGSTDHTVTGRYFVDDVKTEADNRLFVQRSHPQREAARSVITVDGIDVLGVFEQYYRSSEQLAARLVELSTHEMAMVLALPGADAQWLESLDVAAVRALHANASEPIDGRTFRFDCGCDGDRIVTAMVQMFGADPDEVFQGDEGLEVQCPRCGARWWIDRELFDRTRLRG